MGEEVIVPNQHKAYRAAVKLRIRSVIAAACLPVGLLTGCASVEKNQPRVMHSRPQIAEVGQPQVAAAEDFGVAQANLPEVVPASYAGGPGSHHGVSYDAAGACATGACQTECSCGGAACAEPMPHRRDVQEYIFDGGDNETQVVVQKDWTAKGVDPTDTVAYYQTAGGLICVKPSNRVPIYAPRFGAVRQVRGVTLSERAVGTQRILAPVAPGRLDESELVTNVVLPTGPRGEQQVRLLDAFQENNGGVKMDQVLAFGTMSEARVPWENVDFFRTGILQDDELAVLGQILQGARTWFAPESLAVEIKGQNIAVIKDELFAKEIFVYETEDKCSLRICKAASHTIANSGDVISFTIRFDNIGPNSIEKTVILDSLSPRLEYIEGSEQCSIEAVFVKTPNSVGSSILKWELQGEIKPSTGGVISFDCKVR